MIYVKRRSHRVVEINLLVGKSIGGGIGMVIVYRKMIFSYRTTWGIDAVVFVYNLWVGFGQHHGGPRLYRDVYCVYGYTHWCAVCRRTHLSNMHAHTLPCTPQHVQRPYSAPRPSSIPPPLIACLGFVEYDNYYEQSVDGTETRGEWWMMSDAWSIESPTPTPTHPPPLPD